MVHLESGSTDRPACYVVAAREELEEKEAWDAALSFKIVRVNSRAIDITCAATSSVKLIHVFTSQEEFRKLSRQ